MDKKLNQGKFGFNKGILRCSSDLISSNMSSIAIDIEFGLHQVPLEYTNNAVHSSYLHATSKTYVKLNIARSDSDEVIGFVKIHRCVLLYASEVFGDLLGDTNELTLHHDDFEDFNAFVCFTFGVLKESIFLARKDGLLDLAKKYVVPNLYKACEEAIRCDINSQNVLARLKYAHEKHIPLLKQICFDFLIRNKKVYDVTDLSTFLASDGIGELKDELIRKLSDQSMRDYVLLLR